MDAPPPPAAAKAPEPGAEASIDPRRRARAPDAPRAARPLRRRGTPVPR
jgi:hypothetical protein